MPAVIRRRQERHGTAASLAAANEIPLLAEIILETDTGKFKWGDGVNHYNDLSYFSSTPGDVDALPVFNITRFHGSSTPGNITTAIEDAIDAAASAQGGRIYLPSGEWTSDGEHVLPTGVYFDGPASHPDGSGGARIKLMTSGTHLFKIVPGTRNVGFRNVALVGGGLGNTDGVLIEGNYGDAIINIDFENVALAGLKYGCRVNALDTEMQVQQLSFTKCTFNNNSAAGFYCLSQNTLINFYGGTILAPNDGWCFRLASVGIMNVIGTEFVGIPGSLPPSGGLPNTGMAEGVCWASGLQRNLTFQGVQDEGFRYFIRHTEMTAPDSIINVIRSGVQSRISLEGSVRLHSENNYYSFCRVFRDTVTSGSYVTSVNDEFLTGLDTGEAALSLPEPALFLSPSTKILVSKNQAEGLNKGYVQQWPQRFFRPNEFDGATSGRGWLQALSESALPCFEVGGCNANGDPIAGTTYFLTRDFSTGHLVFSGGQPDYQGYDFEDGNVFVREGFVGGAAIQLVEVGGTITLNPNIGNSFYVTLTGNRTLQMTGMSADGKDWANGRLITIEIIQDGTGSRTLALATGAGQFAFGTDIPSITVSTTANKMDVLTVRYSKVLDRFAVVGFVKGF
jgi:hypothetical protein